MAENKDENDLSVIYEKILKFEYIVNKHIIYDPIILDIFIDSSQYFCKYQISLTPLTKKKNQIPRNRKWAGALNRIIYDKTSLIGYGQ